MTFIRRTVRDVGNHAAESAADACRLDDAKAACGGRLARLPFNAASRRELPPTLSRVCQSRWTTFRRKDNNKQQIHTVDCSRHHI